MADRTTTPPRPRRVTVACLIAGAAAAWVLVQAMVLMASQGSLEQQEWIASQLRESGLDGQVTVAEALPWLRWILMGAAAFSVVVIVFSVFTARGHLASRIGLTIVGVLAALAFVLLLSFGGVLPAALMTYGVASLWSPEGRAWFAAVRAQERGEPLPAAGRPDPFAAAPRETDAPRADDTPPALASSPSPPVTWPTARPQADRPPAQDAGPRPGERPFAAGPQTPQGWGQPTGHQPWQQPHQRPATTSTPRSVNVAVVLASVMSGLMVLLLGANALIYLASPEQYREIVSSQSAMTELTAQTGLELVELTRIMFVATSVGTLLAVVSLVSALLLLARMKAARVVLTILSAATFAVSLAAFPLGLVWAAGAAATIVLIWRADANAWFRG